MNSQIEKKFITFNVVFPYFSAMLYIPCSAFWSAWLCVRSEILCTLFWAISECHCVARMGHERFLCLVVQEGGTFCVPWTASHASALSGALCK